MAYTNAQQRARRAAKALLGICDKCCLKAVQGRLCRRHRKENRERSIANFKRRQAEGLCYHCDRKPMEGYTSCKQHNEMVLRANRRYAEKRLA